MRKRRRLADKLTIMVCAVLVAVSAFFYAPMDVNASESYTVDFPTTTMNYSGNYSFHVTGQSFGSVLLTDYFDISPDTYYSVDLSFDCSGFGSVPVSIGNFNLFVSSNSSFKNEWLLYRGYINNSFDVNPSMRIVFNSSELSNYRLYFGYNGSFYNYGSAPFYFDFNTSLVLSNLVELSGVDSESYQNGYNAGYSVGEEVGESNGYSSGYSDGYDAGEQSGYDSGFQAGSDSVDTQSYYDLGYSAGYDAGYLSGYDDGYDSGYDAGWQAYKDTISGWGADTSDYPLKISSFSSASQEIIATVFTSVPSISYEREVLFDLNFDINPNHTYKYVVKARGVGTGLYDALFSDYDLNLSIGSNTFDISRSGFERAFYIPGYNMDSLTCLEMYVYDGVYYGGVSEEDGFLKHIGHVSAKIYDFFIDVYDMGPSGDTQNHIANQTDKLTNGFNDSKGNSVNNDFSSGLNDFETAEDSLFATATTGLKDFTFFDFQSVPAMVTGMSFVGSIMSGWFTQAGGASGVGIVLSILFSIMLVAMVLGLYRWYQSKGGKD